MIKVLHVLSAVNGGGIESMLLNYYKHMDREQVSFDLVAHKGKGDLLKKDFENLGCKVYFITSQRTSIRKNQKELGNILKSNEYDIIHFHHGLFSLGVRVVKKYATQSVSIVHSHAKKKERGIYKPAKSLLSRYIIRTADYYCACGVAAGKYLFGDRLVNEGKVG